MTDLGAVPEDPTACKCHQNFASIAPTHSGHCCFMPADSTCHPAEVEAWVARSRGAAVPAVKPRCPDCDSSHPAIHNLDGTHQCPNAFHSPVPAVEPTPMANGEQAAPGETHYEAVAKAMADSLYRHGFAAGDDMRAAHELLAVARAASYRAAPTTGAVEPTEPSLTKPVIGHPPWANPRRGVPAAVPSDPTAEALTDELAANRLHRLFDVSPRIAESIAASYTLTPKLEARRHV